MLKAQQHPLLFSLLFHLVILSIFVFSFEFSGCHYVMEKSDDSKVVNAILMSAPKIQMPKAEPTPPPKIEKETKKIIPSKPKIISPPKEQAIAISNLHQKKSLDNLLADLKKQADQKKKIVKQKDLIKSFEKEMKLQAAKNLQQQMLNEQNRLASAQSEKMNGVVDKYKALILQAIAAHWLVPASADKSLSTELLIRVAASGTVLDVQLVKSSGDDALDRTPRSAVFKASPLPVPTEPDEFQLFKEFILKLKPQNIIANKNELN